MLLTFSPFRSWTYLVAWIVCLVLLFWVIDWINYGFDYDREKFGTRSQRIKAVLISIPLGILGLLWLALDRVRKRWRNESR